MLKIEAITEKTLVLGIDVGSKTHYARAVSYTHLDVYKRQVEGILEEWNNMAVEEYSNHVGLLPYALDYLLCLKEHGIKPVSYTHL